VTQVPGAPVRALEQAPSDHDAAAHAGAERQHGQVGDAAARAEARLAQHGGVRIVQDHDRSRDGRWQAGPQRVRPVEPLEPGELAR
jgi:hypothetical protein